MSIIIPQITHAQVFHWFCRTKVCAKFANLVTYSQEEPIIRVQTPRTPQILSNRSQVRLLS
jgi:hypothetical protein